MKHYDYFELDAYLHGDAGFFRRIFCTLHLKHCTACANLLERVKRENEPWRKKSDDAERDTKDI